MAIAIRLAIAPNRAVRQPGQGQAHDPQQLAAGVQRQRDHRAHPDGAAGPQAANAGRRVDFLIQVGDDDLHPRHGLLAEVTVRVADRLTGQRPRAGRGLPAAGVRLDPPDQLVALEKVDETVIGELRDEHLGDVPQGGAQLQ